MNSADTSRDSSEPVPSVPSAPASHAAGTAGSVAPTGSSTPTMDSNSQTLAQSSSSQNEIENEKKKIQPASSPELLEQDKIIKTLNSDGAIDVLLSRLKKSILTCEEFAKFIKKKAILQQDFNEHLKKTSKSTQDILTNNSINLKKDSFMVNFEKIIKCDEKLSLNGDNFSKSLFQMYEELSALSNTMAKSRKSIKENYKRKEKEVIDSISNAEKAKNKYDNFCSELERLKTTDPSKKTFTLKGSKTTTEQEEILNKKIEIADSDYRQKVATSTGLRSVYLDSFRPATAKNLKDIIIEIDIAMSLQLQKYTTKLEESVLNNGLLISPINQKESSLKAVASSINNEKDLYEYLLKFSNNPPNKNLIPIQYRQHPSMITSGGHNNQRNFANIGLKNTSNNNIRNVSNSSDKIFTNSIPSKPMQSAPSPFKQSSSTPSSNSALPSAMGAASGAVAGAGAGIAAGAGASAGALSSSISNTPYPLSSNTSINSSLRPVSVINSENVPLPPGTSSNLKTFGTPISELIEFEGEMVPSIVRQCIYVIDKHGLELEGIYRTSGNVSTVSQLRDLIDKDPSNIKLILPNPNSVKDSDVYAVASLLKSYFNSLPEALLTNEASPKFLEYCKIPDPELRL